MQVDQFGPSFDVDAIESALEKVTAVEKFDVEALEALRVAYKLLPLGVQSDGRRSDIVKQLLHAGLPLRGIAVYLDEYDNDLVRLIAPKALAHRTDAILAADETLECGTHAPEEIARVTDLPLDFITQLRQWQLADVVAAHKEAAVLTLLFGMKASEVRRRVFESTGVFVNYDVIVAMNRPARRDSTAARYGLAQLTADYDRGMRTTQ